MKIAMGTDHAGFLLKEKIKEYLLNTGHQVRDFGTHSETPVDYPLFIRPVAEAVASGDFDRGIVLGGSGNGEAIVANRVTGIRCTLCWNVETAVLARKHNDANILSIGARFISFDEALEIVKIWLITPFEGGRHRSRIRRIDHEREPPEQTELSGRPTPGKTQLNESPEGQKRSDRGRSSQTQDHDVLITFRYILYSEGTQSIDFKVDPGLKGPTIIHVPSQDRWNVEMDSWAKDRRDEIIERLKSKCVHLDYEIREY